MPDPILMLKAMLAAAILAAAAAFAFGRFGGKTPSPWLSFGTIVGTTIGFGVGIWLLGLRPNWPPREDTDRFLFVLLPAVIVVELAAAHAGKWQWAAWPLRLALAAAATPILLHDSVYLAEKAGPGSRVWTSDQIWQTLGCLAAVLAVVWACTVLLSQRTGSRSVPLSLVFPCLGAGMALMLSAYASGGQVGIALAPALAGAALVTVAFRGPARLDGLVGLGVVGVFGLAVTGRFFGELPTRDALILVLAPLLAWLPELPRIDGLKPWARGSARVALTAIPVALVLGLAIQRFMADSKKAAPESGGATIEDYMNFGK